jgi:predicted transcriptional regulator
MSIELSKDINKRLLEVADLLDLDEDEIIKRAILLYLDDIQKRVALKKENKSWDRLSDEALENFERVL